MAHVTVLDVGHGNAAVITGSKSTIVVDAPLGPTLLAHLLAEGLSEIDALLISHADADHMGGATNLLLQPTINVRSVYLNTEALRDTNRWRTLRSALAEAEARGAVDLQPALTSSTHWPDFGDFTVEVLSPSPVTALTGAGTEHLAGHQISANEMSAVIRVAGTRASVLLCGDAEPTTVGGMATKDLRADVCVFPHHGGLPGHGDPTTFAQTLTRAVEPSTVVLSLGRGVHNTPQPEIVRGIRDAAPSAHIACTQLSERCAAVLTQQPTHLLDLAARGREPGTSCAGSMRFYLSDAGVATPGFADRHRAFIAAAAPNALCQT